MNKQIAGTPLEGKSLEEVVLSSWNGGSPTPVFNNAAQVWNHTFFWEGMKPNGGGAPSGKLADAINASFGSFDEFKVRVCWWCWCWFCCLRAARGLTFLWEVCPHVNLETNAHHYTPTAKQQHNTTQTEHRPSSRPPARRNLARAGRGSWPTRPASSRSRRRPTR
jgi:hypothetical protein